MDHNYNKNNNNIDDKINYDIIQDKNELINEDKLVNIQDRDDLDDVEVTFIMILFYQYIYKCNNKSMQILNILL